MGGPSPDTVAEPVSPTLALIIADMFARGWNLRSQCDKCHLILTVNAEALIRAHGPALMLWGLRPRCAQVHEGKWRCEGRINYFAQTLAGASWRKLKALTDHDRKVIASANDIRSRRYARPRDEPRGDGESAK
jgi:hypothetical protein